MRSLLISLIRGLHTEANIQLLFLKSVKGNNFVKKTDRGMDLGQTIALVMVNKCVKFEDSSFNSIEVMGKIELFHDEYSAMAYTNTRMMTIPRLVFFEKKWRKNYLTRERVTAFVYITGGFSKFLSVILY